MTKEIILKNYIRGLWTKSMVMMAVKKGIITIEEGNEIISSKQ